MNLVLGARHRRLDVRLSAGFGYVFGGTQVTVSSDLTASDRDHMLGGAVGLLAMGTLEEGVFGGSELGVYLGPAYTWHARNGFFVEAGPAVLFADGDASGFVLFQVGGLARLRP